MPNVIICKLNITQEQFQMQMVILVNKLIQVNKNKLRIGRNKIWLLDSVWMIVGYFRKLEVRRLCLLLILLILDLRINLVEVYFNKNGIHLKLKIKKINFKIIKIIYF